jgi:MerR family mercuric resistance operon transcriptional regulator
MRPELGIGALSKRTRVHVETIRYYERIGILPPPPRSAGGHRVYGADDLRRLVFIRRSRELGFTLDEIRNLLSFVRRGYTCGEVKKAALVHLEDIRRKIADLRRMERTLAGTAARCAGGSAPNCPIMDSLFDGGVSRRVPIKSARGDGRRRPASSSLHIRAAR